MPSLYILPLALVLSGSVFAAPYTREQFSAGIKQNGGPEVFIRGIASRTASMAGQRLDDETELLGAVALERTLVHYVRLVNHTKAEIADLAALRRAVASRNAPSVCTSPSASALIFDYSAEYKYIVYSKSREHLFEYSFDARTCARDFKW